MLEGPFALSRLRVPVSDDDDDEGDVGSILISSLCAAASPYVMGERKEGGGRVLWEFMPSEDVGRYSVSLASARQKVVQVTRKALC